MTGRRLYDLYCDARQRGWSVGPAFAPSTPVAWPFLSSYDKAIFNDMARRLKGVKR